MVALLHLMHLALGKKKSAADNVDSGMLTSRHGRPDEHLSKSKSSRFMAGRPDPVSCGVVAY
jgi:hypothetical protein